jgi:hypothetical protein
VRYASNIAYAPNQSATAMVESDLVLFAIGAAVVGILGYLIYQKVSDTAATIAQSAGQAYENLPSLGDVLPSGPGTNVPYSGPSTGELDPDTYGGYP